MTQSKSLPIGMGFMVLMIALAALGVGYGLWSQRLFIQGRVNTGEVSAVLHGAFTDDDGHVNDPNLDSGDVGGCATFAEVASSCDPADGGPDLKLRRDLDVGRCEAEISPDGITATITAQEAYPGYFCTAWLVLNNNGMLPVKIAGISVNEMPFAPEQPTSMDLDSDQLVDIAIRLGGIQICQQLDPNGALLMDLQQAIQADAPQQSELAYTVQVQLVQWNESCP